MAYDFPASPTIGQTSNGYTWNGQAWGGNGNLAAVAPPGEVPPTAPANGQLWWETDTGNLYVWYNDGTSSQWVQISGPGLGDAPSDGKPYTRQSGVWVSDGWRVMLDETTTVAQNQFTAIPLAGIRSLDIDAEIYVNNAVATTALVWQISLDGGLTWAADATGYSFVFHYASNSTPVATSGTSNAGYMSQGWNPAAWGMPIMVKGRYSTGNATKVAAYSGTYGLLLSGASAETSGTIMSRTSNFCSPTHFRILVSVASGIGIGSRILVKGR